MRLKRLWRLLDCDAASELDTIRAALASLRSATTEAAQLATGRIEVLESAIVQLASELNELRNSAMADIGQTEPTPKVRVTKRFREFAAAAVAARKSTK